MKHLRCANQLPAPTPGTLEGLGLGLPFFGVFHTRTLVCLGYFLLHLKKRTIAIEYWCIEAVPTVLRKLTLESAREMTKLRQQDKQSWFIGS